MKHKLSLLIAVLLVSSVLTGCSNSGDIQHEDEQGSQTVKTTDSLIVTSDHYEAEQSNEMADSTPVTSDNYEELQSAGAYFDEARLSINIDRDEIMAMLTEVIETYGSQESPEKTQAQEQKQKIMDYINMEKVVEDILKTKGFAKVFVLMTDNSVNVTLDKQDVSKTDIYTIIDVVRSETGRGREQITIQSKL